jgi:hypothetical protein
VRPETPDIHFVRVDGGFALQDPFGHQFADAAAAGDPVVRSAGGNIKAF